MLKKEVFWNTSDVKFMLSNNQGIKSFEYEGYKVSHLPYQMKPICSCNVVLKH